MSTTTAKQAADALADLMTAYQIIGPAGEVTRNNIIRLFRCRRQDVSHAVIALAEAVRGAEYGKDETGHPEVTKRLDAQLDRIRKLETRDYELTQRAGRIERNVAAIEADTERRLTALEDRPMRVVLERADYDARVERTREKLARDAINEAMFGDRIKPGDCVRLKTSPHYAGVVLATYSKCDVAHAVIDIQPANLQFIYPFDQLEVTGKETMAMADLLRKARH